MGYSIRFTPSFEKQLKKIKKKDRILFKRLATKLKEIKKNPDSFSALSVTSV